MTARFFGKNPHKRYVRQLPNRNIPHIIKEKVVKENEKDDKKMVVKENKENKKDNDMADERLEKIEAIMDTKAPKRKIKVEKKDKGLLERTDNSTILLTEDNKMLLND